MCDVWGMRKGTVCAASCLWAVLIAGTANADVYQFSRYGQPPSALGGWDLGRAIPIIYSGDGKGLSAKASIGYTLNALRAEGEFGMAAVKKGVLPKEN